MEEAPHAVPQEVDKIKLAMQKELGHPLDPCRSPNGSWKLYYTNRQGVKIFYITIAYDSKHWIPKAVSHVLPGSELIDNA